MNFVNHGPCRFRDVRGYLCVVPLNRFDVPLLAAMPLAAIDLLLVGTRTHNVFTQASKEVSGTAKTFSAISGFSQLVMETVLSHRGVDVHATSQVAIAVQQRVADAFQSLGLLPVSINVSDTLHKP
jgi:hypothetical protein